MVDVGYFGSMSANADWVPADTFGARLMLLRHQLGLSTEEIAGRCDLKTPTWSTWERGASPRNMPGVVARITLATGVDRDWLMWGGPLGAGPHAGGPSASTGYRAVWDNDTELMQYRSLAPARNLETIKAAA